MMMAAQAQEHFCFQQHTAPVGSQAQKCARAGSVSTPHGRIRTPAALLYTRRGSPLSLTPDLLSSMKHPPGAYGVDALQLLASPSPETLASYGQGGHRFLSIPSDWPMLATNRDPTMYEYGPKPSTEQGAYVTIHTGSLLVPPAKYMASIAALKPDLYVALSDEITNDAKPKRVATSIKRSAKWLDTCMELHAANGLEGACGILAAVGGGGSAAERAVAARAVAEKPVSGFALSGFVTGEAPGAEREALLGAAIQHLPPNKLRYLPGMLTPGDLLDCIAQGVDIFDGAYPLQAASEGYALCFPLHPDQPGSLGSPDAETGADNNKINLWSTAYRLDKSTLVPGCDCYACSRHSRAYVHHLLQTNEMLGDVLLEVHNTHHFQAFISVVRGAIEAGTFEAYREWFWYRQRNLESQQQQGDGGAFGGVHKEGSVESQGDGSQDGVGGAGKKRPAWVRLGEQKEGEEQQKQKQPKSEGDR